MKTFRLLFLLLICASSCNWSNNGEFFFGDGMPEMGPGGGGAADDGAAPDFDPVIAEWDGERADDASLDIIGTEEDFYHELNSFPNVVTVTYNGSSASVQSSDANILTHSSGAHVTIDMKTNIVSGVEIVISGKSDDGSLKVYGEKKFKLTMKGVELTSKLGPAVNSQCKKRIYVHLQEGTTNRLADCESYGDDAYYLDSSVSEDRKGCFFSEGHLVFSGTGVLAVSGKYKHGIVTDGYFRMRPGVTVAVVEAGKNGIHVKGDTDDKIGFHMAGGLLYANVSATAGKGIKTDLDAEIAGGRLMLNTSGNAEYESDENDTSSAAGIKSDGSIIISGGVHTLKSTGTGGKGLNSDADVKILGGETTITTSGGKYTYSSKLTSSPKGVKADGNVIVSGGKLNISVTGKSDGSEGLESKGAMTISGGEVYVYAYDDAINAGTAFEVTGGRVYAYASNNDGIDSNGTLVISGGLVIGSGSGSPEGGIDCDNSSRFKINGGTVIGTGGTMMASPSSASTQRSVVYNGMSASMGALVTVLDSSSKPILTYELPRTMNSGTFFFSSPDISSGESYTISSGGTLTDHTENWNGWYAGGAWSGGTEMTTFTAGGVVTSIGSSSGGGPGGGGWPGGGGGWPW